MNPGQTNIPIPWEEGDNIPWNDPEFSRRMLAEHLDQGHDLASRKSETIEKQVEWIQSTLLDHSKSADILDLGCGPGFYTEALAKRGHRCVGVDFSPASIEYAKAQAACEKLNINYIEQDIRKVDLKSSFDLVMLIFGEFNIFSKPDATGILQNIHGLLKPGGHLLLEVQTFERVKSTGHESEWSREFKKGLFSDQPHIWQMTFFWDEQVKAATTRYCITDLKTESVQTYASSVQAYAQEEYVEAMESVGFEKIQFLPSLDGQEIMEGFQVIVAVKSG